MAETKTVATDVAIETRIAAYMQQVLNLETVMPSLITDYSALVGPGMNVLKIPRAGKFTVSSVTEGTAVEAQVNAVSTDSLNLDKFEAVQFSIVDMANLQSKVAMVPFLLQQAGKDLATKMDQTILDALEAGVSTASPDHKIAYDLSGTTNVISKQDFINARKLLNIQYVPAADRACVISPASEAAVLAIGEFVKVNESGSEQALRNGLIGKLFGFDVYCLPIAEDLKSMFFHKSTMAFARQQMPKVEMARELEYLADRYSASHIYGVKQLDSGKRSVLIGTA